MSLTSIKGKKVELGNTEVLIEDLGLGGIKFLSTLNLPARPDITLQFTTIILDTEVQFIGNIVWKQEWNDIFQYGIKYEMTDTERTELAGLFNKWSIQLRTNPLLPNCPFVQEDKITYLKKNISTN